MKKLLFLITLAIGLMGCEQPEHQPTAFQCWIYDESGKWFNQVDVMVDGRQYWMMDDKFDAGFKIPELIQYGSGFTIVLRYGAHPKYYIEIKNITDDTKVYLEDFSITGHRIRIETRGDWE
jgi:hypothetical protein